MRCKTQENYDSFKCPLNSPKCQPMRNHKSSRSEDIDLLQFSVQDNLLSEMNYSSVHEVSISSARNSTQHTEIIKKQEEIIRNQEQHIKVLKNIIMNQQTKTDLELQLKQLNQFVQRVFLEIGTHINKENQYDNKDYDLCIVNLQQQKQRLKDQGRFIQCMRELIISCSPPDYFQNDSPNLKQVWRFIKMMLNECVEIKKNHEEVQTTISQIQKILHVNSIKQIVPYLLVYKPTKQS